MMDVEQLVADMVSEDHIIAAELGKKLSDMFPNIRTGYLVSERAKYHALDIVIKINLAFQFFPPSFFPLPSDLKDQCSTCRRSAL